MKKGEFFFTDLFNILFLFINLQTFSKDWVFFIAGVAQLTRAADL